MRTSAARKIRQRLFAGNNFLQLHFIYANQKTFATIYIVTFKYKKTCTMKLQRNMANLTELN
jgi:hypothetical protein